MDSFSPMMVIEKITMLFLVLLCGYYAAKRGFLSEKTPRSLSLFLVNVTQPALIVASFHMPYTPEKIRTGLIILAASVLIHIAVALLAAPFTRRVKDPDSNRVYRYALIFANCSFLGFPVLDSIFGEGVGVFYGTFYCIMFNVFNFTYGISLLRRGRGERPKWYRAILNPGVLSTIVGVMIYLCRIPLPGVISSTLKMVGDMTFPVSMVIVGALLASLKFSDLFCKWPFYVFCLGKNVLLPLCVILVCKICGFSGEIALLCVTMCAVPTAASCAIFAETYQSDSALAARLVGLTTLLSVVTLPAMVILANAVL